VPAPEAEPLVRVAELGHRNPGEARLPVVEALRPPLDACREPRERAPGGHGRGVPRAVRVRRGAEAARVAGEAEEAEARARAGARRDERRAPERARAVALVVAEPPAVPRIARLLGRHGRRAREQ